MKDRFKSVIKSEGFFKINGVDCVKNVHLKNNTLCACENGAKFTVNGFVIPAGSEVRFVDKKFEMFYLKSPINYNGKKILEGKTFWIDDNGNPLPFTKYDPEHFNYGD